MPLNSKLKGDVGMTEREIWIPIPLCDGIYEASNKGRVRRALQYRHASSHGTMKLRRNKNGYVYVCLSINNKPVQHRVHKLVSQAFLGDRPNGTQVNHIDGNKENNIPNNLEYVTQSINMKHCYKLGLQKPRQGTAVPYSKLSEADVLNILRLEGCLTHKEIAKKFRVTRKTISAILSGRSWSHLTNRKFSERNKNRGRPKEI